MTPMQVIMLAYRMRQAQKQFQSSLKGEGGLGKRLVEMADLEDQFDAAITPYIEHAKNLNEGIDHEV